MTAVRGLKGRMAQMALPLARLYIRYMPGLLGKLPLFHWFGWRAHDYTVRTRFGALMSGRSDDLVQGYIYYFGVWEPNLSAFIHARLSGCSRRSFVDVGANVGYFSLLAAGCLKDGAVVAIEAFPAIFRKLEANVRLNKFRNVRLVPYAATDVEQGIGMYYAGSANEGATTSVAGTFPGEPEVVPGKPLSALLTDQEIESVRLIKIDVEGAEYAVIQGMRQIIEQLPADAEVIVEVTPSAYAEGHLEEMFGIFESAGFLPYKLVNSYDPRAYIGSSPFAPPGRLQALPSEQADIVFSRIAGDYLV